MNKCKIIYGTNYSEVESIINRFLSFYRDIELIKIVNLSDENSIAMAIFYKI